MSPPIQPRFYVYENTKISTVVDTIGSGMLKSVYENTKISTVVDLSFSPEKLLGL